MGRDEDTPVAIRHVASLLAEELIPLGLASEQEFENQGIEKII